MSEAVIGLIGVVIGGLLTGWVSYLLEGARTRAALRAQSRLLLSPLVSLDVCIRDRVEAWHTLPRDQLELPADRINAEIAEVVKLWRHNRDLFAAVKDGSDWVALDIAMESAIQLGEHVPAWQAKVKELNEVAEAVEREPPVEEVSDVDTQIRRLEDAKTRMETGSLSLDIEALAFTNALGMMEVGGDVLRRLGQLPSASGRGRSGAIDAKEDTAQSDAEPVAEEGLVGKVPRAAAEPHKGPQAARRPEASQTTGVSE